MSNTRAAFVACSILAGLTAVLLGYSAGAFYREGGSGFGELVAAILMCGAAGAFAFAARFEPPAPKPPKPPEPMKHRKWCFTDW